MEPMINIGSFMLKFCLMDGCCHLDKSPAQFEHSIGVTSKAEIFTKKKLNCPPY